MNIAVTFSKSAFEAVETAVGKVFLIELRVSLAPQSISAAIFDCVFSSVSDGAIVAIFLVAARVRNENAANLAVGFQWLAEQFASMPPLVFRTDEGVAVVAISP